MDFFSKLFANKEDLSREAIAAQALETFNAALSEQGLPRLSDNNIELLQNSIKDSLREYKHKEHPVDNNRDIARRDFYFREQSDDSIKEFGENIGREIFSSINENLTSGNISERIIRITSQNQDRYPFSDLDSIVSDAMNESIARNTTVVRAQPYLPQAEAHLVAPPKKTPEVKAKLVESPNPPYNPDYKPEPTTNRVIGAFTSSVEQGKKNTPSNQDISTPYNPDYLPDAPANFPERLLPNTPTSIILDRGKRSFSERSEESEGLIR